MPRHAPLAVSFAIPLLALALFASGVLAQLAKSAEHGLGDGLGLAALSLALTAAAAWAWLRRARWLPPTAALLAEHGRTVDVLGRSPRHGAWIALAAGAGLFAELVLIRLHASYFQLFAYFKNVSLLSCFLGLGIGYTLARRRALGTALVLPLIGLQAIVLHLLRAQAVAPFLQNPVQEQLALGLEQGQGFAHLLTAYGFLSMVFAWNALCFLPLGQLAARLMEGQPKLRAYGFNLVGSLLGIALFYAASYLRTPPAVWLAAVALLLLPFLAGHRPSLALGAGAAVLTVAVLGMPLEHNRIDIYSPYQILTLEAARGEIDAVEIDPEIQRIGAELHPESPYQAANVNAVIDDARAFLRHTERRYDLIVYGLLDSHTLLSGRSGVRLDSYVYTVEAFREARARLRPGGLLSMTFSLMSPQLARKLFLMLQQAFDGQQPVVYLTAYDSGITFLIGAGLEERSLYRSLGFREFTAMFADPALEADPSTDDWPFLYMAERAYPRSYLLIILVLLAISLLLTRAWSGGAGSGGGFSAPCFFLGAGFMLVETKAITELALEFGSTWVVTGVAIAAVLVMAFLANLVVLSRGAPRPAVAYGLLCLAILAGWATPSSAFDGLPPGLARLALTALLTVPLFFSGFAFSSQLARTATIAAALSSNLLGAMLGGFLEYNAMYFGFRSLYLLALAMYLMAWLTQERARLRVRPQPDAP